MAMEMRGTLNVSKFQKNSNQPRFYGKCLINGVEYKLKGWEKINTDGEPWISLLFENLIESEISTDLFSTLFSTGLADDDIIPF